MGLFTRAKKTPRYPASPDAVSAQSTPINNSYNSDFADWYYSGVRSAGQVINELTAMQVSSVYACVSLIGGTVASLPLPVYIRSNNAREKIQNNVYWLLNEQPCPYYSAAVFWESMMSSLLLHGDAFAVIRRRDNRVDNIQSIEWLDPRYVTVLRDNKTQMLIYKIETDTDKYNLSEQDIIHIPGPGFNGLRGMSQLKWVLRHPASIALAADKYSAAFFENGARPDFAIELAGNPTTEQQEMMRSSWSDRYQGVDKSHKPVLLTGGAKVHELTMSAEDSQLLATRQFQVEDIARVFGVPSHMIGSSSSTVWGSGIDEMTRGFVKFTLGRHLNKIEEELNRKLWPLQTKYFIEFSVSGLERGDFKTRMEGYRSALGRAGEDAWMMIDEVRQLENLPPVPGGDILRTATTPSATAAITTP